MTSQSQSPPREPSLFNRLNGVTTRVEEQDGGRLTCEAAVTGINVFAIGFSLLFIPLAAALAIVFWQAGEPWAAAIPGGLGLVALIMVPPSIYSAKRRRLRTAVEVIDGVISWEVDLPFPLRGCSEGKVDLREVNSVEVLHGQEGGVVTINLVLRDGQRVPIPVALSSALATSWQEPFLWSVRHWRPDLVDQFP